MLPQLSNFFIYIYIYIYIFAISEHCLFEEQLGFIKSATGNTFNCHAVSAYDNPPKIIIMSGNYAHGGVVTIEMFSK